MMRHLFAPALGAALLLAGCSGSADSLFAPGLTARGSVQASIAGSVTSGGAGVPGVLVTVSGPVTRTATTSATGAYTFTELPAGPYTVTIDVPDGFALGQGQPGAVNVEVGNGTNGNVRFELAATTTRVP